MLNGESLKDERRDSSSDLEEIYRPNFRMGEKSWDPGLGFFCITEVGGGPYTRLHIWRAFYQHWQV